MAKFMFQASYTPEGAKGLLKDGGSGRRAAVEKLAKSAGGKLEQMWFAFGADDVFIVAELPDNASAAAISLTVGAAGGVRCRTVQLLSVEELDQASKKSMDYRKPGS
jgi:uncharacterized protein with GYD domain